MTTAEENAGAGEIVRAEAGELAQQEEPNSIMSVIARAAADPRVDVEKMRALLDMQVRIEARQAEVEFNAALARLMPKLPRIEKDGAIKDGRGQIRSRWARYETIDLIVRPLLAEEGFSVSFNTEDGVSGQIRIVGTLSHRLGHSRTSQVTLPTNGPPGTTGAQAVGSTVSYGKRYVLSSMLNIVTVGEDDDGRGGAEAITPDQVSTLEMLLKDTRSDKKKFLAWAGVSQLSEILSKDFTVAVKALEAKRRNEAAKGRR